MKPKAKKRSWIMWAVVVRKDKLLVQICDTAQDARDAVDVFGDERERPGRRWAMVKKVIVREL